jgi:hypothetical protein
MPRPICRSQAARDALLAWLYNHGSHPQRAVRIDRFLRDLRSARDRQFFSPSDIQDAAGYLQERAWLTEPESVSASASHRPYHRHRMDCIEPGGSVSEYAKQPAKTNVRYSFNAPVSGANLAIGDNAIQHATINNVDPNSLVTLMNAIIQAIPSLDMGVQDQKDAEDATNEVMVQVEQKEPGKPRLQAALKRVGDLLSRAGNQALSAVLSAAIDYERTKLGLPPAS